MAKPAVNELVDMVVDEVSVVDRAANGRKFLLVKRAAKAMSLPTGSKPKLTAAATALLSLVEAARTAAPEGKTAAVQAALRAAVEMQHARDARKVRKVSLRQLEEQLRAAIVGRYQLGDSCYLYVADVFDDRVVFEMNGKFFQLAYTVAGEAVTLGDAHQEVVRVWSYAPVAMAAPPAEAPPAQPDPVTALLDEAGARAKFLLSNIEDAVEQDDADESAAAEAVAQHATPIAELCRSALEYLTPGDAPGRNAPEEKNMDPKTLNDEQIKSTAKLLGCEPNADAIGKRMDALSKVEADNAQLRQKLAEQTTEAGELAKRVAGLESDKAKRDHESVFKGLVDAGKLPPSLHGWAQKQSAEALREWGEGAPVVQSAERKSAGGPPITETAPQGEVTLTEEDRQAAAMMGVPEEKFLESKKAELAKRAARLRAVS